MLSVVGYCQNDSTTIKFLLPAKELQIRDNLLGIQQLRIHCSDISAKGKVFFLSITEYKKGKAVVIDTINASCGTETVPMQLGERKVEIHINYCDKMRFSDSDSVFNLVLTGILKEKLFKINTSYPGRNSTMTLRGNSSYMLTWVNSCNGSNEMKIPLNKKIPVVTYAPPVKGENNLNSFCIRGEEDVEKWYETFNIEHYYIFYLMVK